MASLNTGLNIARAGLMASQTALDVTSQNISNASVEGYCRQTLNLQTIGANTGSYRIADSLTRVGNGVDYKSLTQSRDSFLDVSYRNANSQHSDWQGQSNALTSIEGIFNEFASSGTTDTAQGLSGKMTDLLKSLKSYQNTPTDTTLPTTVKSAVSNVAFTIRDNYKSLSDFEAQEKSDLSETINGSGTGGGLNAILDNISALNTQIAGYETSGNKANNLRDQRNVLLDKLSGNVDISVTEQSNGMVTVGLANDTTGKMLISANNTVTGLQLNSTKDAVQWADGSNTAATVTGGTVDAYLQVINGNGTGSGTYGTQGIVYFKNKLNDFAKNFDQILNKFAAEYQSPAPADVDAAPCALISYDNLNPNPAATIDISANWKTTDGLFATNYTGASANIGNYIGELIGTLNKSGIATITNAVDHSASAYSGSFVDLADSFTGDIANTLSHIKNKADTTSSIVDNIDSQRQQISSVSIDEEGINMIKYQQSYTASSRVITTINDMLDTIIKSMGL